MRTLLAVGTFRPPLSALHWRRCTVLPLALMLVCAACASPTSALSPSTMASSDPPHPLAASAWQQLSLPTPATDMQGIAVSPTDPATLFACTAQLQTPQPPGDTPPQPLTLWRTTDSGADWTRYDPVLGSGTQCLFSTAPDDPQRLTVQVAQTAQHARPCAHDAFYLSADGGTTWRPLPAHTSIAPTSVSGWCDLHVTRKHLYLDYSFTFFPQAAQVSLLERSDDNGISWVRADRGLGDNVLFTMPEIGPADTLAVTVTHVPMQPQMPPASAPTMLWLSTDAGNTWRQASTLPEGAGTYLLTSWPTQGTTWPAPNHPFFALESEQIPSDLYRERVLASGDGLTWTLLPPLPVSGVTAERPGILQALGVLPDGRLAVWGPDPQGGVPAADAIQEQVPAFWVWLWDPATQRWQVIPSPLRSPAGEGCGLCWQAGIAAGRDGTIYLYVARFDTGAVGTARPGVFRLRLPPGHMSA